jgi:ribosomal protein S6--L-glutamate ligase
MILSFHPCFAADVQIIFGDRNINSEDLASIQKAEAIILPQSCSFDLYQACKHSSALVFPNYEVRFQYPGKIGQSLLFKGLRFSHPETMDWSSVKGFRKEYAKGGGFPHRIPFLIKTNESHEAEGVYIISGKRDLDSSLNFIARLERSGSSGFISQELIPSEGNVLRAVILGRNVITYWKRPESPGQIVTTISRGAKIDKDWRTDLQEEGRVQALKLSESANLDLAAIDFVFDFSQPKPSPLFLEINYYFGRRGLGGSLQYYRLLAQAIQEWLKANSFDPESVTLV